MGWLIDLAEKKGLQNLLAQEELLPGLPEELTRPGGPTARLTWWQAAAGAGKTLVGRWLQARHGWTFVAAATWSEAVPQLPEGGDVFVELADAADPRLAKMEPSSARRLCIAAVQAPIERADVEEAPRLGRWTLLTTPPPPSWQRRLIDWAVARSAEAGGFDRREIHRFFDEESLGDSFGTPGDLLGFLAMMEEVGLAGLRAALRPPADPVRMVRAWWKLTRERTEGEQVAAAAAGVERLVELEVARLRREQEPGVRHGAPAEGPEGREVLPSWVARMLRDAAIARLSGAGDGLGALLLHVETAEEALLGLVLEVYVGRVDRVRREVMKQPSGSPSAEELAALDGAFRAIGLVLAAGAEVPDELVGAAWQRQAVYLAPRHDGWPATPIRSMAAPRGERGKASLGAWFVAALAISKRLAESDAPPAPIPGLTPWSEESLAAAEQRPLAVALDHATFALHHNGDEAEPWRSLPFALGEQLLDRFGILRGGGRDGGQIVEAQQPAILVRLASYEDLELTDEERRELLRLPWGLRVLESSCGRHAAALDDVLRWCRTESGEGEDEDEGEGK